VNKKKKKKWHEKAPIRLKRQNCCASAVPGAQRKCGGLVVIKRKHLSRIGEKLAEECVLEVKKKRDNPISRIIGRR